MKKVQDALTGIVPVYAAVLPPLRDMPESYCVYSTLTVEEDHSDDSCDFLKTHVYLFLWTDSDPTEHAKAIRAAMRAAGFAMTEETDQGYKEPAYSGVTRRYTVQWTWTIREPAEGAEGDG